MSQMSMWIHQCLLFTFWQVFFFIRAFCNSLLKRHYLCPQNYFQCRLWFFWPAWLICCSSSRGVSGEDWHPRWHFCHCQPCPGGGGSFQNKERAWKRSKLFFFLHFNHLPKLLPEVDWLSYALDLSPGQYENKSVLKRAKVGQIYSLNSDKYFLVDGAMPRFLVAASRPADPILPSHQLLEQHAKGDLQQETFDYLII